MDINQVKNDFENGTLICRATMATVIDMAMTAASCNAKNEKTIVRLHAELEAARAPTASTLKPCTQPGCTYPVCACVSGGICLPPAESATADMEDPVLVPRGLIGSACYLIRKHAPDSTLLEKLRAFTFDRYDAVSCHPDDFAVDHFAGAMKAKMADSRAKGRSGWNDPLLCTSGFLRRLLVQSVRKGDPVDVGNFAMMLHARGATTMLPALNEDIDKQIAIVDAQRHQRLERRLQNVPVELERRAGYDRRVRVEPKG